MALRPTLGAPVPLDVAVTDEAGRRTTVRACTDGKPAVLLFAWYDCPMLCTETINGLTRGLIEIPQDAGTDFEVLVVSIDPSATPALAAAKKATTLRRYGREGAERGWHFLTASPDAIARLTAACGFRYTVQDGRYAHPSGVLVLTPDGRISRCLLGITYLPNDLRLSLVEASRGTIGTFVEKLQLLCWQYDPTTGRYGFWIFGLVRLLSLLTLGILAGAIVRQVRREKHAASH